MTRAKFKVTEKAIVSGGDSRIKLSPVTGGSEENKSFYKWTPSGSIELGLVNKETADLFEIDKEYFVDFSPAS